MSEALEHMTPQQRELMRARILRVLEIYPRVSPSMLHVGIGPQHKIRMWRPVLEDLIAEGVIVQEDLIALTSTDREQVYRILRLADNYNKHEA